MRTTTAQAYAISATPLVRPMPGEAVAREKLRQQVTAERGVDALSLFRAGSNARIRTECAVAAETALRTRIAQRQGLAAMVDLSV